MPLAKTILRSIGAVLTGYILTGLLTFITVATLGALFPASYLPENVEWVVLNVAYGCLFAAAGGYVTAWLAPTHPTRHALALGLIMAVLAAITGLAVAAAPPSPEYASQPGWYYPALAVTVLPSVWAGAWFRTRAAPARRATAA
jgi:hypothetical protein